MILRFIVENITSFKDAVEFNTFPSSKSHNHDNHKVSCGHATALRMAAIYGANGAGKSNLIDTLQLLSTMVRNGSILGLSLADVPFKFNNNVASDISGLALEYYYNDHVYYYHVEFSENVIHLEELLLCNKNKDITIFKREGDDITVKGKFFTQRTNSLYLDTIKRMVRPDMLMLSFMGYYYPNESSYITEAYRWFVSKLRIVKPGYVSGFVPHLLDTDKQFSDLVNTTIPELKTGIDKLVVKKDVLTDNVINSNPTLQSVVKQAKDHPGEPQAYSEPFNPISYNIVYDSQQDVVYSKKIVPIHKRLDNSEVEMSMLSESDGTRRLIEYMPLFYSVIQNGGVYVVDEIERSIHPILIKSIISKISESTKATGQLIFTTHESGLLDQNIFRPDEIWFAQKDSEQATQLYPLSDFNIHHTANIENGYLNGRYGGIPFLSNLKDLHW